MFARATFPFRPGSNGMTQGPRHFIAWSIARMSGSVTIQGTSQTQVPPPAQAPQAATVLIGRCSQSGCLWCSVSLRSYSPDTSFGRNAPAHHPSEQRKRFKALIGQLKTGGLIGRSKKPKAEERGVTVNGQEAFQTGSSRVNQQCRLPMSARHRWTSWAQALDYPGSESQLVARPIALRRFRGERSSQ